MARNEAPKRIRVLVDLGASVGAPLVRALPAELYHRGRRLRELALLGLTAETAGLRVDVAADGWPMLRGDNVALIRLDGGQEIPPTLPVREGRQTVAEERPPDVVLPQGFLDQFVS